MLLRFLKYIFGEGEASPEVAPADSVDREPFKVKNLGDKLQEMGNDIVDNLPELFAALVVLVAFFLIARLTRKRLVKTIHRLTHNNAVTQVLSASLYLLWIGTGIFIGLSLLNLDSLVTSLLAGAGILTLALGLAFQDIMANFISGVFIAFKGPFRVGDLIQYKDFVGEVTKVDLRTILVRTYTGQSILIPSKEILQNPITNFTKLHKRKVDLQVGISYKEDLEAVKELTETVLQRLPFIMPGSAVKFFYESFGDSSIKFQVYFWVKFHHLEDYYYARSEAIIAIKKAFDEHGITIPYPIRTLEKGESFVQEPTGTL